MISFLLADFRARLSLSQAPGQNMAPVAGWFGGWPMKIICLVLGLLVTTTLAQAEDVAALISQYRRAHGLSAV